MAIDFDMMSVVAYCLPDAKHNKKDFDRDFNRFIVKQDMLSIATNKAQAEGRLDEFLSYVDNQVAVDVVHGCDDKSRLSVAIENAYLAESVRAKLYGNESFGDVAHAVLSCVYSRMSEAFHPIRDEILANKYDKSLDSLYSRLSYKMDETFVSVADKVNKIKPHMLADWFEEELGTLRQEVDMIGLDMTGSHKDGYVTKRDDDALLLGMLCERYYDEHFAKMGFSSELKHYRPHMMDDVDYYRLMQDSAMFHDWQRRLDESSRKVLNLPSEPEDESEKEF